MNNRIKEVRKAVGLSQEKFAEKIAMSRASVAKMELGMRDVGDRTILTISTIFNVNPEWLRTGEGEMFKAPQGVLLDLLADEYKLSELDKKLVETYINLDASHRYAIVDFIQKLKNGLS